MKQWILISLLASVSLLTTAEKKRKSDPSAEVLKMIVDSKEYRIDVEQVIPRHHRPIRLDYGYHLTLKQDTVVSLLPYYGTAHDGTYRTDNGMQFTEIASKYYVRYTKKGEAEISFEAVTSNDRYRFFITISKERMVQVNINSNRQSPILYLGKLDVEVLEKKSP